MESMVNQCLIKITNKIMKFVDDRLDVLYERVKEMALEQASFNSMIQNQHEGMANPFRKEVD